MHALFPASFSVFFCLEEIAFASHRIQLCVSASEQPFLNPHLQVSDMKAGSGRHGIPYRCLCMSNQDSV